MIAYRRTDESCILALFTIESQTHSGGYNNQKIISYLNRTLNSHSSNRYTIYGCRVTNDNYSPQKLIFRTFAVEFIFGAGNVDKYIGVYTLFAGVRNPIKALFSVLDHYNMLKHTKYTFQVVRHVPVPENRQIDHISGNSQRWINILASYFLG